MHAYPPKADRDAAARAVRAARREELAQGWERQRLASTARAALQDLSPQARQLLRAAGLAVPISDHEPISDAEETR